MSDFKKIGKFDVTEKLGQGSFGIVYRGRDPDLKRDVAIKVCSVDDEDLRKRFLREAEISGNLQHKNIVTVFAFGYEQEIPYLVQEYLPGEDLRELIKRKAPLVPRDKLDYLRQVAQGLVYAHSQGVIHRDIKPGNVRLLEDGTNKIMDFGIAKLASAETQLTQKGVTMGTASYLPPEQVRGGDLDHRADIFSFGVLAYELLTYERPFRGNTLSALVYQILYKVPLPMTGVWPECPEELSDLVAKCLEKKPERRFASVEELIPELTAIVEGIDAGKWPTLLEAPSAEAALGEPPSEDSDVMSESLISRTAKDVSEGKGSSNNLRTGPTNRAAPLPPDPSATLAVQGQAADGPTAVIPTIPAAAAPVTPPPLPAAFAAGGGKADAEPKPELASRARQISSLIVQGNLETAMKELEHTRAEFKEAVPPPPPSPVIAAPPETPRAAAAAEQPVRAAETTRPDDRNLHTAQTIKLDRPPAADVLSELPSFAEVKAPSQPAVREPAMREPEGVGSGTYRTAIFALWGWRLWAGLAALLVVVVGGSLLIWGGRGESPPEPQPLTPTPPPVTEPVAAPAAILGGVSIITPPWGNVTEITNADGYVQDPPADPSTPSYLQLPVGKYTIQLQNQDGSEYFTCEVEVSQGATGSCAAEFPASATVTEYFKESGWWK
ncbi:MAG: serine/threonine protein kinase [bacterium]|nr:serine/threonine protein kinase [bacterium]